MMTNQYALYNPLAVSFERFHFNLHSPHSADVVPPDEGLRELPEAAVALVSRLGVPPSQLPNVAGDAVAAGPVAGLRGLLANAIDKVLSLEGVGRATSQTRTHHEEDDG